MKKYTEIEKQSILLLSDLLTGSLTKEEYKEIKKIGFDFSTKLIVNELKNTLVGDKLISKLENLLSRKMEMSLELEKITQRGVDIIFLTKLDLDDTILKYFDYKPEFIFCTGNQNLLLEKDVRIVTRFAELDRIKSNKIIFIIDASFNEIIKKKEILEKIYKKEIVLISDMYRSKSNLSASRVFISGSRTQKEIPLIVQDSIEQIKSQGFKIIIGDSNKGVDNEIIDYLRIPLTYKKVEIFSSKTTSRVKIEPDWGHTVVKTAEKLSPRERQMVKDRKMGELADWGLAIFNPLSKNRYGALEVSVGTLRNTIQMLLDKKAVKFFFLFEGNMCVKNLRNISDLEELISGYSVEVLSNEEKDMILSAKGVTGDLEASSEKFKRIKEKFDEMLEKERNYESKTLTIQEDTQLKFDFN